MPASIELRNYYFHQISSFCCIHVLCCINHWWHLSIAGGPVSARSPDFMHIWCPCTLLTAKSLPASWHC